MILLEERLRALGEVLDVDEPELADAVLGRLDAAPAGRPCSGTGHRTLSRVAVIALVVGLAVLAVPSSRRTVAGWFGLDGADVERRPGVEVPAEPDPLDRGAGTGTVVTIVGGEVLVSSFDGRLDTPAISKTLGDGSDIREVLVGGSPGLWIDGAPHEVAFLDPDGHVVFEGVAGNTLLWQDGDVIRRVEGFADVGSAIRFAETVDG